MAFTDEELVALLADLESDRVERKESAKDHDKLSQAVCAFANDLPGSGEPGVLFIGVRDKGGLTGQPVTDALLRSLGELRESGSVLPPPSMSVRKLSVEDGEVAVVVVQPSTAPPVRYKGRIYVRVGPRRGIANADDERRLNERRRALDLPFDARPLRGATVDDLDLGFFERSLLPSLQPADVLAENGRTLEQRLSALRFTSPEGTPTAAGLLSSGNDPVGWLPGAYVQFLRVDGEDLAAPIIDEKRIDGTLPDVLRQLDELLTLNVTTPVDFTSAEREARTPDYPLPALQQVVRNAIMHRSYEHTNSPVRLTWFRDRIEIVNPGGPYGVVNEENFGTGVTDYRNPTLAEVMRGLGYVQRFGAGIPIMKNSLVRNGNPEPEFVVTAAHVAVTLRRRS
ncbi:ATP-binding protein [Amycolatopsis magusensis]|uniref:ATP-binding protein n=1 Tax=Amycolatopsis magusensis TaxID=882444 RepID=UPI00378E47A3